jgi:hypothetical protein
MNTDTHLMQIETPAQSEGASSEAAPPIRRFCAAPLRHTFVDLGMSIPKVRVL